MPPSDSEDDEAEDGDAKAKAKAKFKKKAADGADGGSAEQAAAGGAPQLTRKEQKALEADMERLALVRQRR
jgi:hypothetical protein